MYMEAVIYKLEQLWLAEVCVSPEEQYRPTWASCCMCMEAEIYKLWAIMISLSLC